MTREKLQELQDLASNYLTGLNKNNYVSQDGVLVRHDYNGEKIERALIGAIGPLVNRIIELESYMEEDEE